MNLLKENMYLAEDRILCFETVMKAGSGWHLGYVKTAKAEDDSQGDMVDFIVQRRRWLNGAFATTIYSVLHFHQFYRSGHSLPRMALFHIQFIYNIVNFLLSWFSLAGFLLTLFIVNEISGSPPPGSQVSGFPFGKATPIFNAVLQVIYVCMIVVQFILALGTRPRAARWSYFVSFIIFGIIQVYFIMNVIYLFKRVADVRFKDSNQGAKNFEYINVYYSDIGDVTVVVSSVAVFGVYIAAGFLHLDPWHIFTSYAQYLFIVSSYTNILNIYAFSNFNDHSWGCKGARPEPSVQASAISKTTTDHQVILEEPDIPQDHIDFHFEAVVKRALAPYVPPQIKIKRTLDDDAKIFRTRLIGIYIFSNFFVCIFVLNDSSKQLHWLGDSYWHKIWFFRIWLWANAACLYFRFLGSFVDLGKKYLCCIFMRR
jgi:chitin synthase